MNGVIEGINARNWDALGKLLSEDVVHHSTLGDQVGRDAALTFYKMLCDQMGWKIEVRSSTTTDKWLAAIHANHFTPATVEATTVGRIADGKVAELWTLGNPDDAGKLGL